MKAILTVIAKDRVGIIARVCSLLSSLDINILDINQTVMEGIFTMTVLIDTSTSKYSFNKIRKELLTLGETQELNIHIQKTDIFNAMHRV